jgi:prepilin-type N-terminal cleavage/methylation domain-containing protein
MRRNQKGFTLMELMVVIVIVAILAAVAVPLYINYVRDAQRTEAKGAIGAVITAEQTNFQVTGAYASDDFTTGLGTTLNCDLTEAKSHWKITVAATGGTGYVVTAVGLGTVADAGTVTYTYDRTTGVGTWNP